MKVFSRMDVLHEPNDDLCFPILWCYALVSYSALGFSHDDLSSKTSPNFFDSTCIQIFVPINRILFVHLMMIFWNLLCW